MRETHQMIRTVFAVAAAAVIAIGVCTASAQEDPIKARKTLMKANGDAAKLAGDMAKGDKPYDQAAVNKIFATFQDASAKMPALFPDSSKAGEPGDDYNASPKIWE